MVRQSNTANNDSRVIERNAFIWNTAAGLLMAFQSVFMLMLIMRLCDVVAAGIYTIAYANANLFLTLGNYGMRQFQVSDRTPQFSFLDYRNSRFATTAAMIIVGVIYLVVTSVQFGYSVDKFIIILIMYLFKSVDSLEDVFHGNYQQYGRLDVGARVLTFRLASTLIIFGISLFVFHELLWALLCATIYTFVFFVCETFYIKCSFNMPSPLGSFSKKELLQLLKVCFPLFAAAFLLFYIGNASKYSIDAFMDDSAQAYFGFIAMPVFVVSLLSSFVYNPMIASLADTWQEKQTKKFLLSFGKICLIILLIASICIALAWFLGVPVLNWLYNTDVANYRNELTALVAGGTFLALTSLATLGIAIIRFQKVLLVVYAIVSVAALFAANHAVSNWGITGASWVYFFTMLVLAIILWSCFITGALRKGKRKSDVSAV